MPDSCNNRNGENREQFGSYQDMLQTTDSISSYFENNVNHWQSKLGITQKDLEFERNKLAEILLAKDKLISFIANRKKTQARLEDCINNPAKHPELKPGDRENYINILLPQNEKSLMRDTLVLQKRNEAQQQCESNIVRLENEIADLEYKLEINQNLITILNYPSTLFTHRTFISLQKIDSTIPNIAHIDSTRKPRQ